MLRPRLLRLLLRLGLTALLLRAALASAATAATAAAALLVVGCWLSVVGGGTRLLLLLLLLGALLALLAALGVGLLSALRALPFALFRPPIPLSGPRALALAALVTTPSRRAGLLLPLAQFLLHEAPLLRLGARTRLVVSAVGAALPAFGISLFAVRADDALRERHAKSARIVHFAPWPTTTAARRFRR